MNVFDEIAKREGISVTKVRKDVKKAIDFGLANPDPVVQAEWAKIPKKGKKPTPEEVIVYIAEKVKSGF